MFNQHLEARSSERATRYGLDSPNRMTSQMRANPHQLPTGKSSGIAFDVDHHVPPSSTV